jgi:hypothetical protein
MKERELEDIDGHTLPYSGVRALAVYNIMLSSEPEEIAEMLADRLTEDELLDWALESDGRFPQADDPYPDAGDDER